MVRNKIMSTSLKFHVTKRKMEISCLPHLLMTGNEKFCNFNKIIFCSRWCSTMIQCLPMLIYIIITLFSCVYTLWKRFIWLLLSKNNLCWQSKGYVDGPWSISGPCGFFKIQFTARVNRPTDADWILGNFHKFTIG